MARKKKTEQKPTPPATNEESKPVEASEAAETPEQPATEPVESPNGVDAPAKTSTEEAQPAAEAESGEAPAEPEAPPEPSLEEQLEQARQEAARNLEGWQRAAAELANFKRRQEEQMKLTRDRIKAEVLEGVISALDDLDLAFQNVPQDLEGQVLGWVEGFRLVQRKLNKILEDQNVMPINTEGQFDPNFHEAISHEDSEEHEEGEIIAEVRKGYQIGNRVLRPALVRVAR
ncbi:MAG: nucleotide exchange factor GrpE [Chloroflexi bacterium]|nr:MAG: nucleotide exchange factor GrpE [Chloroflexota bacterium]